jgi:hypothetical protein
MDDSDRVTASALFRATSKKVISHFRYTFMKRRSRKNLAVSYSAAVLSLRYQGNALIDWIWGVLSPTRTYPFWGNFRVAGHPGRTGGRVTVLSARV